MTETKQKSPLTKRAEKAFPAREIILEILLEVTSGREYSHIMIRNVLEKYDYIKPEDKALIKRISEGTLERMIQLDYVIDQFSNTKTTKMKPVIVNILRMAVYQILFMDKIPDSAACNEAVRLAEKKKFFQLKGFVNGVLRNIIRSKDQIKYPNPDKNRDLNLSIRYSMPQWIIKLWDEQYSKALTEQMLEGLLKEHPVVIRIKESLAKDEKESLLKEMEQRGISCQQHPYLDYAYRLDHVEGAFMIPGFAKGIVTIQDVSSMLAVEVAKIRSDMHIIDVCAAPGGKATLAAEKLSGSGMVEARDLTDYKTDLINQNIQRMNLTNITAQKADALVLDSEKIETANVVIADLPCSGLGVIGKKRDIKYHISQDSIFEITELQKKILNVVWQYVKCGGALIYSTCTINKTENDEVVRWFTENYPFELESITESLPEQLRSVDTDEGHLQLMPGVHETDGFYMARLVRKKN